MDYKFSKISVWISILTTKQNRLNNQIKNFEVIIWNWVKNLAVKTKKVNNMINLKQTCNVGAFHALYYKNLDC